MGNSMRNKAGDNVLVMAISFLFILSCHLLTETKTTGQRRWKQRNIIRMGERRL